MTAIATKLGALIKPNCITGTIQKDANGHPACTVVNHLTSANNPKPVDVSIPNCDANGGAAPCWTLDTDPTACPKGGRRPEDHAGSGRHERRQPEQHHRLLALPAGIDRPRRC